MYMGEALGCVYGGGPGLCIGGRPGAVYRMNYTSPNNWYTHWVNFSSRFQIHAQIAPIPPSDTQSLLDKLTQTSLLSEVAVPG